MFGLQRTHHEAPYEVKDAEEPDLPADQVYGLEWAAETWRATVVQGLEARAVQLETVRRVPGQPPEQQRPRHERDSQRDCQQLTCRTDGRYRRAPGAQQSKQYLQHVKSGYAQLTRDQQRKRDATSNRQNNNSNLMHSLKLAYTSIKLTIPF